MKKFNLEELSGVQKEKPLDRQTKLILLQVLKRGFFTEDDIIYLWVNHYTQSMVLIKTYEGCPDDMQEEEI